MYVIQSLRKILHKFYNSINNEQISEGEYSLGKTASHDKRLV